MPKYDNPLIMSKWQNIWQYIRYKLACFSHKKKKNSRLTNLCLCIWKFFSTFVRENIICMAAFEFSPIAESVKLELKCPGCGKIFATGALAVPSPDFTAETHADSTEYEYYEEQCPECGQLINICLSNGFGGGYGDVDVYDEDFFGCDEQFVDEGYDYDRELFEASHAEIAQLVEAIESLPDDVKGKIYKLLYANAITNLETYLGDTLKKYVLTNEKYLRKYAEKYPPFAKEKLFDDMHVLREKVTDSLNGLLYHNLWKQKGIYKAVLDVDFGIIEDLSKAINIRHDIVHRNGKDKNGREHVITKADVLDVANKVNNLIYRIDCSLPLLNPQIFRLE